MFIAGHGKGKWMRNGAFMMAGGNFITNILFIPRWGAYGAAVASAVSMGFSICVYIYYYSRYIRERGE